MLLYLLHTKIDFNSIATLCCTWNNSGERRSCISFIQQTLFHIEYINLCVMTKISRFIVCGLRKLELFPIIRCSKFLEHTVVEILFALIHGNQMKFCEVICANCITEMKRFLQRTQTELVLSHNEQINLSKVQVKCKENYDAKTIVSCLSTLLCIMLVMDNEVSKH